MNSKIFFFIICILGFHSICSAQASMIEVSFPVSNNSSHKLQSGIGISYHQIRNNLMLGLGANYKTFQKEAINTSAPYRYDAYGMELSIGKRTNNIKTLDYYGQIKLNTEYISGKVNNELGVIDVNNDGFSTLGMGMGITAGVIYKKISIGFTGSQTFYNNSLGLGLNVGYCFGKRKARNLTYTLPETIPNQTSPIEKEAATSSIQTITPSKGTSVALIVGNSHYKGTMNIGDIGVNDAIAMQQQLEECGFITHTLLDCDRKTFLDSLASIKSKYKDIESLLFYYSGHGIKINNSFCLSTVDVAVNHFTEPAYLIPIDVVFRTMNEINAKVNITVVDACRYKINSQTNIRIYPNQYLLENNIVFHAVPEGVGVMVPDGEGMSLFTAKFIDIIRTGCEIRDFREQLCTKEIKEQFGYLPPINNQLYSNIKFYFIEPE